MIKLEKKQYIKLGSTVKSVKRRTKLSNAWPDNCKTELHIANL